jgi:UDP-N-acetyl-D-galactosamine dehydrogenase
VTELKDYNCQVDVFDPWATVEEAQHEYGITPVVQPEQGAYDGIILAVAHRQFVELGIDKIRQFGKTGHVLYDLKYLFPAQASDLRL